MLDHLMCIVLCFRGLSGRVFELEVDVRDQACLGVLAALNKCTAQQYETDDRVRLVSPCLAIVVSYFVGKFSFVDVDFVSAMVVLILLPLFIVLKLQHAEKLAYLARRLYVLEQERTALTTALDLLISPTSEASNTIKDEKMDVENKPRGGAAEAEEKNGSESKVDQQKLQEELLLACLCPLYQ